MAFPKSKKIDREPLFRPASRVMTKTYGKGTVVSSQVVKAKGEGTFEYVIVKIDGEHRREFIAESLTPL